MLEVKNAGVTKGMNIIIVAYYYPPCNAVGGKRIANFYKRLKQRGHRVNILTANWMGDYEAGNEDIIRIGSEIAYGGPTSLAPGKKRGIHALLHPSGFIRSIDRSLFSSWYRSLRRWIHDNPDFFSDTDVVFASYKPTACILLGKAISRRYHIPLVSDLRDLMSIYGLKERVPVFDWVDRMLDRMLVGASAEIITVSYTSQKKAKEFYGREVRLVTNSFHTGDENRELKVNEDLMDEADPIRIVYTGTLSESRNPKTIVEWTERFNQSHSEQIVIEIASRQDPFGFIDHKSECLIWRGYLNAQDTKHLQSGASICLMLEDFSPGGIENIPAKLYEYVAAGKPIIALCHKDSDIGKVLEQTGGGEIISSFEAYESFCLNRHCYRWDSEAISMFDSRTTTMELEAILSQAVGGRNDQICR